MAAALAGPVSQIQRYHTAYIQLHLIDQNAQYDRLHDTCFPRERLHSSRTYSEFILESVIISSTPASESTSHYMIAAFFTENPGITTFIMAGLE